MIQKVFAFQSGEQFFHSIEDAQKNELIELIKADPVPVDIARIVAGRIIEASVLVVDILTMTPKSRPRARKANGGRKQRLPMPKPPAQVDAV